ncbi:hypothetical protein OESDEN_24754, partial [Oesophagostomum dentatum]
LLNISFFSGILCHRSLSAWLLCSFPAATPVIEKILDSQEIVDFDKSMRRLRVIIAELPKDKFSNGEQEITEKQWYTFAKSIWNEPLFDALLDQYKGYL